MNASGSLVGRISGLVMLCLALGRWPRGASKDEDRQTLAPLIALEPARHRLSDLRRDGRGERWRAALAGSRDAPRPYDPTGARLAKPAGGRMMHRREAERPWARCQRGSAIRVSGSVRKEQQMKKAVSDSLKRTLIGTVLSVALMLMAGAVAPSMAEDSLEQDLGIIRACGSDVWSLCSGVLPDVGRLKACIQDKMGQLSKDCIDKVLDKMAGQSFKVCKNQTYALCARRAAMCTTASPTVSAT